MKIATILFTYNRCWHTEQVLNSLKNNIKLPDKLYIFQDGLGEEKQRFEWEKVNSLIHSVDWIDCEVIVSEYNKGLAESIVSGIDFVFNDYEAVIVLEDDCVAHPLFVQYVTDCLYKYKNYPRVFSVNGSSWPVNIERNGKDAYFSGRISSHGWATWKDRWGVCERNYRLLYEIKQDKEKFAQYNIWGQDLENYLLGNIEGKCNSWAVFWALQCIKQGGYCPTPYQSLINNIGFDGSGVHCGKVEIGTKTRDWNDINRIHLPEIIEFPANYQEAYSDTFKWVSPEIKLKCYNQLLYQWNTILQSGNSINVYLKAKGISTIAIWGRGKLCQLLLREINNSVEVKCIIESNPTITEYNGINVVAFNQIPDGIQKIIVIPVYDMEQITRKIKNKELLLGLNEVLDELTKA